MPHFAIIDAPSILGLIPSGVERLPEALNLAGLQTGLKADYAGLVPPPPYHPQRDLETRLLNPDGLRAYAQQLAEAVTVAMQQGKFPVVLGGDCSNIIGKHIIAPLVLRNVVADHEVKERLIKQSRLKWTIVRPPRLTNGRHTGAYRSGERIAANSIIPTISRADLADFMLKQLTDDTYLRKAPAVMY